MNHSYLLKLKIISKDLELRKKYEEAVAKMNTDEYRENTHKDSGFDIFTPLPNDPSNSIIEPASTKLVDLEIQCAAYKGYSWPGATVLVPTAYFIYPRSSIYKSCVRLANNVGIIDSGYRGNLKAALDNKVCSSSSETVKNGIWDQKEQAYGRLLQICMPDLSPFHVEIVDELDETIRGEGGIGSTGK